MCSSLFWGSYPHDTGRELPCAPLRHPSLTTDLRVEVSVPNSDPKIPSIIGYIKENNWLNT